VSAADVRNWTAAVWLSLNVAIVIALIAIRVGAEFRQGWRHFKPRQHQNVVKKQLEMKEERALYERMREARKRQII